MTLSGFVLAYHGCDKEVGERILAGKDHVRVSTNDYDWLGPGAYFLGEQSAKSLGLGQVPQVP